MVEHYQDRLKDEKLLNWPNSITLARTVGCLVILAQAIAAANIGLNYAALVIHWIFDMLDGYLARLLHQETRFGAQFDILADRLVLALFYFNLLTTNINLVLPVIVFLVIFMLLDHYLSNQYIQWGLISLNYFYQVDQLVWLLNWSPTGKFINSGLVTLLILAAGNSWVLMPVFCGLIILKIYSIIRVHSLPLPQTWKKSEHPSQIKFAPKPIGWSVWGLGKR